MPDQSHLIRSVGEYWSILPSRAEAIIGLYENLPEDYLSTVARMRNQARKDERDNKASNKITTEKSSGESRFANKVDSNGVLTLSLRGEVVQSGTSYADYFGETEIALDSLNNILEQAKVDPFVKALSILIDSPGGVAIASRNTADMIADFGKPVFAMITEVAASAGYDLISSANKIYALHNHISGSIGTMTSVTNRSKQDQQNGILKLYFASGERKLVGSPDKNGDIPQEHLDMIQEHVNKLGGQFVDAVATRRNLTPSQKADVAKAGIYVGAESVKAGLVDKITTMEGYRQEVAAYMSGKKTMPASSTKGKNQMAKEDEDNLISDPLELSDLTDLEDKNDDSAKEPVKNKLSDTEIQAKNSELLTVLAENKIESADQLKNILAFATIGTSARNSLVETVQRYHAMVNGEECTDKFDDMTYDRLMQYGASLRKTAIANKMIEEPKRETLDDAANSTSGTGKKPAPVGENKVPMAELVLQQKNALRGIPNNTGGQK